MDFRPVRVLKLSGPVFILSGTEGEPTPDFKITETAQLTEC